MNVFRVPRQPKNQRNMTEKEGYSPRNRAERVISVGRLILAVFLLVALVVDPPQPASSADLIRGFGFWYLTYCAGLALLTWQARTTTRSVTLISQFVDLVVFSVVLHFGEGPTSPFFVYFVFATICGALRWQARGALLTGGAVIATYILLTVSGALRPGGFQTVRLIARCTHLALVTGLLAYLGRYQQRLQQEIESLAAWPRRLPIRESEAVHEVLTYAARVLGAPRMVLVWEEEDEPLLRVASLSGGHCEMTRERPDGFGGIVVELLRRSSFLTADVGSGACDVLQRVPGGFRFWRGTPLDAAFRDRYRVRSVVGLRLGTATIEGWLFALDRRRPSADDILLGDIVGRLVTSALELNALVAQLREAAAGEERLRLARELHDGVLQSLTAAALQAQRARQAIGTDPAEAERRLATIEQTILTEQQALRLAITDLNPVVIRDMTVNDCSERVRDAAMRVAGQWDVRVQLEVQAGIMAVPRQTAHEVTRMVQESLVNAVRHGGAREVRLSFSASASTLRLAVSYEGRGFPGLDGRHDLALLTEMHAGPRTLKERVTALDGSLVIDSGARGARVEITVPITSAR
jgi:signal transduction histidine kinase